MRRKHQFDRSSLTPRRLLEIDTTTFPMQSSGQGSGYTNHSFLLRKLYSTAIVILMATAIGTILYVEKKNHQTHEPQLRIQTQKEPLSLSILSTKDSATKISTDGSTTDETRGTEDRVVRRVVEMEEIHLHSTTTNTRQTKKQQLYLHVGPQKTGSSTLQSLWDRTVPALGQDGYVHRHITPERGDFDCDVGSEGEYYNCVASQQLKGYIDTSKREGRNVLLTDENLDQRFAQTLRDTIDGNDWEVTVVVVYRRIHEWLTSWYNQINKTANVDSNGNLLLTDDGIPTRKPHTYWPHQGGVRVPTFSSWYFDYTGSWNNTLPHLVNHHRSVDFFETYDALFENVVVYNFHHDGDLATNFMCDVIQNTPTVCERLRDHAIQGTKMNPSIQLRYDILAVSAYDQGLLLNNNNVPSLSRPEVVDAIANFVALSGKELPWKCDDHLIDQVRDWLIGSERKVYASVWNPTMEIDLNNIYNSYLESGALCDLDLDVLFSDDDWIAFFKSL
jgi:hypothetical protein